MGLVLLWFESRMSPTGLCLGFSDSSLWGSAESCGALSYSLESLLPGTCYVNKKKPSP